jgi:hypothetical protein
LAPGKGKTVNNRQARAKSLIKGAFLGEKEQDEQANYIILTRLCQTIPGLLILKSGGKEEIRQATSYFM